MKKYVPTWESLDSRKIPKWFNEAKFGIFIHWGVYSVPAWRKLNPERFGSYAEWYYAGVYGNYKNNEDDFHKRNFGEEFEYREFAPLFKGELFDPSKWASIIENSGAKYVVFTSKHHDGYCMWGTKNKHKKNWNCVDVGPQRDLMKDLFKSINRLGLKTGIYYSIIDWETNSSHRASDKYFVPRKMVEKYGIEEKSYVQEILLPQLKELVNTFNPSLIFADGGEWDLTEEETEIKDFLSWLYNESSCKSEVVVNDRFCVEMPGQHGDYFSSEYKDVEISGLKHAWEESRGIGQSYGYNRAENLEDYSTSHELIMELIEIVSKGGNFLLNIGPTCDGRIPVIQQQRLSDIGKWLKVNGEAVYGSTSAEIISINNTYFTKKENVLYAISEIFPAEELVLDLAQPVKDITLLGSSHKVKWAQSKNKLQIYSPAVTIRDIPSAHAVSYKIELR